MSGKKKAGLDTKNLPLETFNLAQFGHYSTRSQVSIAPGEFRFSFQEIPAAKEDEVIVSEVARLYLSPIHAKAFSELLTNQVQKFEDLFGEIKDPSDPNRA